MLPLPSTSISLTASSTAAPTSSLPIPQKPKSSATTAPITTNPPSTAPKLPGGTTSLPPATCRASAIPKSGRKSKPWSVSASTLPPRHPSPPQSAPDSRLEHTRLSVHPTVTLHLILIVDCDSDVDAESNPTNPCHSDQAGALATAPGGTRRSQPPKPSLRPVTPSSHTLSASRNVPCS